MSAWPEHPGQIQTKLDRSPRDGRDKDWDDYQRRRQWEEYDREMATYPDRAPKDGIRGRSRSPPGDESRKRRRSPSPWDRGRHDPRPRYGDDRDFRRDDYGRRGGHGYGGGRQGRPPPQNPFEQDAPAQLKQFAEWFRFAHPDQAAEEDRLDSEALRESGRDGPKPRDGIRARWEKYKKDFAADQLNIMFEYHKKSPWFQEKYNPSPEFIRLRQRVRKEGWRGRFGQFLLELDEGQHDPDLTFGAASANGAVSSPKNLVSPIVETPTKEGIMGDDLGKVKAEDEDMTFGLEGEDDAADNEVKNETSSKSQVDGRRSSTRDDGISVMPEGNEVMIRTIPPDIGRVKLEDVCSTVQGFMHLALGEPLQKRNFYRAGWIRLQDDTDMEKAVQELGEKKVDGFKLHVTHTTRPFMTRIRTAPDVASRPERIKKDLEQIRQLASILEEEAATLRQFSPTQARKAAEAAAASAPTENSGTDGGANETKVEDGGSTAEGDFDPDVEAEIEPEPKAKGSEAVEKRISKIIADLQEQSSPSELEDGIGWEAKKDTIALDLYREYLRRAYNTCYYCAAITDHVEELQRKCVSHRRKPLSQKMLDEIVEAKKAVETDVDMEGAGEGEVKTEGENDKAREKPAESREWKRNDERWLDWLDSKMALLINRTEVDPRDYGGKSPQDELTKVCQQHIKQEDEGKFRCKQCNKLFKAMSFVEKHVANKHPELIKHLDDLTYFNNFAMDPHRMQPFTHPPPVVGGNNQGPPPQAYGLKGIFNSVAPMDMGHARGMYYPFPPPPPPDPYGAYPPPPYYNTWPHVPYPPPYHPSMMEQPMGGGGGGSGGRGGRRLTDRLGGFTDLPHNVDTLPPKPGGVFGGSRAPPPDVREDPRASGGRKVSYHDIDKAAVGDDVNVELSY